MTTPGGEWVAVPVPGEADRWDYVPGEQPPSPDGSPGKWHVVGGSGTEVGKWEWFPAAAAPPPPPPPPPPPAPQPAWDPTPSEPAAWEPTPSEPGSAPWEPTPPPPFGAPQPAGWHAAPPMAVAPKRSWKLPLIIVGVVVLVAAIGTGAVLALTGGDDGKNKEEITALVNYVTTADDGKDVCSTHLTDDFVDTIFGDVATCENDDEEESDDSSADATGATVSNIEIEDDDATATVTVIGGDTDGATGTWGFRKGEDKIWRVSEWRADYLRSSLDRTFGTNYDSEGPDDPFDDDSVRGCVKDKLLGQDDAAFLDTAYALFRDSDESVEKLLGFMSECPSDTEGVSALRALFEKGFRASAQLPPAITECIVLGMRTGLSEEEIKSLSLNRDAPLPSEIQSRIEQITIGCAGSPATFDPTPEDFTAQPPSLGT